MVDYDRNNYIRFHFFVSFPDSNETIHGQVFCGDNLTTSDKEAHCGESRREGSSLYYALFILGMVIGGIGNSPLYGLGVPYLDQNIKSNVSPMYMGIFVGFGGILGKANQDKFFLFSLQWKQALNSLVGNNRF